MPIDKQNKQINKDEKHAIKILSMAANEPRNTSDDIPTYSFQIKELSMKNFKGQNLLHLAILSNNTDFMKELFVYHYDEAIKLSKEKDKDKKLPGDYIMNYKDLQDKYSKCLKIPLGDRVRISYSGQGFEKLPVLPGTDLVISGSLDNNYNSSLKRV